DGRVGCENVRRSDDLERRIKIEFSLDHFPADALEREKRRVALVHVKNFRVDLERLERFHAADAEQDLLPHSHFLIAAVKLGGDEAVFGVVFRNVGVEEKQIDAANMELPDFGEHFAVQNPNGHEQVRAVALHFADRQVMKILVETDRLLRAVLVDLLPKITVAIKKSDRDEV